MLKNDLKWHEDSPKERELDRLNCEAMSRHHDLKCVAENFDDPTEEDEFRSFKFLVENSCTINSLLPIDFFTKENKLTQKMKDYINGRNNGAGK